MGYNRQTNVSCTNPALIDSGSTFNHEWKDSILKIENGVTYYNCRKEYLNDALFELSKEYPNETFTGVTWNDSDYDDCIKYTLIFKNGEYNVVKMEPEYQYLFPVIENEECNKLAERFKAHLEIYLKRIDIIKANPVEGTVFDFLNDKKDKDGFSSYYTIVWENDQHKFTATKRFTSLVIMDYQKKEPKLDKILELEEGQDKKEPKGSNNFPF